MFAFFLACAAIGGVILLVQLVLALVGAEAHAPEDVQLSHALGGGLDLFSARALSAGIAFFGFAGAGAVRAGWGPVTATAAALVAGLTAMIAVASILRVLMRLEDDGTVQVSGALGREGTVYLAIPGAQGGAGKVTLTLQGRTVEYHAVTRGEPLPTGAPVVVVDVVGPDTLEVVATPDVGV